ncbi:MAG: hypothetical protein KIT31_07170 [Deltaproteobacteria bacterium]|nr:hypothetical protein [Deltaproteobacteria bacterium]
MRLDVSASRSMYARLSSPRSDDPLAERFARLTAERRARLLGFLADVRRRTAINDIPRELVVADGFVYWVLPRQIGRIAVAGGTSQLVAQPPIKDALFDHLAVDHDRIVVAVARPSRSGRWKTEVWQLDGEPRRITTIDTLVSRLIIDGETIVWSRYNTKQEEVEIIVMDFAGAQQGASLPGSLLAAHDGMIYTTGYGWTDETYVIDRDRRERRIARATDATLVNGRLVGRFIDDEFNTTIGSIPTVGGD